MRRAPQRGFTLMELIGILILVGVLAVVVLPKFDSIGSFAPTRYRDELIATLRDAAHAAMSHRRLVCASLGTSGLSLSIAASNTPGSPPSGCSTTYLPARGQALAAPAGISTSATPTAFLYFQPSGRVTTDAAGTTAGNWTISVSGESAITLVGETGHLQ